ncbi:MAG: NAD(P)/FAD-dependent oxidoreductase [Gammaproteobacteria bacterium]|nr:NAD(P)/FAD-dependent oxidoreductase [Gammaproteobacteria bacterium]
MSESVQVVVVGAGVVGLACARRFAMAGYDTLVLEAESTFGTGVSARSSEVIHAGIYYAEGSLKAKLCLEGREALYRYCESRGVAHRQIGKWIVASDENQLSALADLRDTAYKNCCTEVVWVEPAQLKSQAPELRCAGALYSPRTGIVDSHGFMQSLIADIESSGGILAFRSSVREIRIRNGGFALQLRDTQETTLNARIVINSTGLSAPQLAATVQGLKPSVPSAAFAKGNYFSYSGKVPFPHLVYPVPETGGLGVHLTFDLDGRARFGPDVEWVDSPEYSVNAGRINRFAESIRQYWPAVDAGKLQPAYAGVRPKLGSRESFSKDFVIQDEQMHGIAGLWNLMGIESPGLTASLALAEHVFSTHRKLS